MKKVFKFLVLTIFALMVAISPLSKISAENPTLNMSLFAEQFNGKTGKVAWVINFSSTGIPAGTNVNVSLYESGKIIETTNTILDKDGKGTYYTQSVLNPSTKYNIIAVVKNPGLTASLERTIPSEATNNQDLPSTDATTIKDNVVNVDTLKSKSGDTYKYKLLAPFAGFKEAPENIGDYLNKIFIIAIALCGALAVVMIIIAGVQYMGEESFTSKGNAKKRIQDALYGLLIALGAYALLNTIDPRLLGKQGLTIKAVSLEIDPEVESEPWESYSSTGSKVLCPEGFTNVTTYSTPKNISVCKTIAPGLTKLINKANEEGIKLSGYGARSTEQQKALRIKHGCPNDQTPSNQCNPDTARPGYSMHESGKAVDFNCNGVSMTQSGDKKSVCFVWLSKNAGPLLKNLKSGKESWHWSTDGR